eukprot:PhM_4_TR3025/c0_g1_i2/m.46491
MLTAWILILYLSLHHIIVPVYAADCQTISIASDRSAWADRGICYHFTRTHDNYGGSAGTRLFEDLFTPDLFTTGSAYRIESFDFKSSLPWYSIHLDDGPSVVKTPTTDPTQFKATRLEYISWWRSWLRTVMIHPKPAPNYGSIVRVYEFVWSLNPALPTLNSATTTEPHYYEFVSTPKTWSDAKADCESKILFGYKGYLATSTTTDENAFLAPMSTDATLWVALTDGTTKVTWTWKTGPETGKTMKFSNWDSNQPDTLLSGELFIYVDNSTAKWSVGVAADTHPYVCEFGGTASIDPQKRVLRGAHLFKYVLNECSDMQYERFWATPFACTRLYLNQKFHQKLNRNLFSGISNLVQSSDFSAKFKKLTITNYPPMCEPLTVSPAGTIVIDTNTFTELTASGSDTVANYLNVMNTINFIACVRVGETIDGYQFTWNLEPDLTTYLMPPYYEPHYYWHNTDEGVAATTWASALTYCKNKKLLGLPGYLATFTSQEEQSIATRFHTLTGWIGGRGRNSLVEWVWRSGPEEGRSLSATTWGGQWCADPGAIDGVPQFGGSCSSGWTAEAYATDSINFFCEFGGTDGEKVFRGVTIIYVRNTECAPLSAESVEQRHCSSEHLVQKKGQFYLKEFMAFPATADMTSEEKVQGLNIHIAPAMCDVYVHVSDTHGTGFSYSNSHVSFTGSADFQYYIGFVHGVQLTTCRRFAGVIVTHELTWQFVPDLPSMAVGADTHYYKSLSSGSGEQFANAVELCFGSNQFGLRGYLATISSGTENNLVLSVGGSGAWAGASNPTRGYEYVWLGGPEVNKATSYSNWDSDNPNGFFGQPYGVAILSSGKWDDEYAPDVSQGYDKAMPTVCEYGGLSDHVVLQGVITFKVETLECDFAERNQYTYRGECVNVHAVQRPTEPTTTRLFKPELLPSLIAADYQHDAREFRLTVSPPMCHPLTANISSANIVMSVSTLTEMRLVGVETVTHYYKTLMSIKMKACLGESGNRTTTRSYIMQWEITPNMVSVPSIETKEPHYYEQVSAATTWAAAMVQCQQRSVFGLVGHLATLTSANENDGIHAEGYTGWIALQNYKNYGTWRWTAGTDIDVTMSFKNFTNSSTFTNPEGTVVSVLPTGLWDRVFDNATRPYICEFGGTTSPKTFRGTFNVDVTSSPCNIFARAKYGFRGTCHKVEHSNQIARRPPTTLPLFTSDRVYDLIATDATYNAKRFVMTISPPLCHELTYVLSGGVSKSTSNTSHLVLTGVVSVASYYAVLTTMEVTGCLRFEATVDEYDILWELEPNVPAHIDPATGEPHYYEYTAGIATWDTALAACAAKTMFGLRGYLVTVTSDSENTFLSINNFGGWIAATNSQSDALWRWYSGYEIDHVISSPMWAGGEGNLGDAVAHLDATTRTWYDVERNFGTVLGYTCEFGGESSMLGFRGMVRYVVTTRELTPTLSSTGTLTSTEDLTSSLSVSMGTVSPSSMATQSMSPSVMKTLSLSATVSGIASATMNTLTRSGEVTRTPSGPTLSLTSSFTASVMESNTHTLSISRSVAPSHSVSGAPTPSVPYTLPDTFTPTATFSRSLAPTETRTSSNTHTAPPTHTPTDSNSFSASVSPSTSPTVTPGPTASATASSSGSSSETSTQSLTESASQSHSTTGSISRFTSTFSPTFVHVSSTMTMTATYTHSEGTPSAAKTLSMSGTTTVSDPTPSASKATISGTSVKTNTKSTSQSGTHTPSSSITKSPADTLSPTASPTWSLTSPSPTLSRTQSLSGTLTLPPTRTTSWTLSPPRTATPKLTRTNTFPQTVTPSLSRTHGKSPSLTSSFSTDPSKTTTQSRTRTLSRTIGTPTLSDDPTLSFSGATTTLSTKGIVIPVPSVTSPVTVTVLSTLSQTSEATRTVMHRHPNDNVRTRSATIVPHRRPRTATRSAAVDATATHNVTVTVTPPVDGATTPPTSTSGSGTPNGPSFAPITIMPQGTVAPLPTLSPGEEGTNAPLATGSVEVRNTFKVNTWVLDNSVPMMFSLVFVMVGAVSVAWYWSHRLRRRPPRVDMFVEPIEPRAVWPEPYRYGRALLALFPNPQSAFVPPRNLPLPKRPRAPSLVPSAGSVSATEDVPTDNCSLVNMMD